MDSKKKRELLILLILAVVLPISIFAAQSIIRLRSSADTKPNNVLVTNVGVNHFSVSWSTTENVMGKILWGTNKDALTNTTADDRIAYGGNATKKNHHVTVSAPGTQTTSEVAYKACDTSLETVCASIYAYPQQITLGESVELRYYSQNATAVAINGEEYNQYVGGGPGSVTFTPSRSGTFTYTIRADNGIDEPDTNTTQFTVTQIQQGSDILGTIIDDQNGNASLDSGEGVYTQSSLPVSLSNGQSTASSTFDGNFRFTNVQDGSYSVSLGSIPNGWRSTGSSSVLVAAPQGSQVVRFYLQSAAAATSTISGRVGISSQGGSAGPLTGAIVTINGGGGTPTNSSGDFSFSNIAAGSHTICLIVPSGYQLFMGPFGPTENCGSVSVPPSRTNLNFGVDRITSSVPPTATGTLRPSSSASTSPSPSFSFSPTLLTVTTDKTTYTPGSIIRTCWTVPQAGIVTITNVKTGGTSEQLASGYDSGSGGCISVLASTSSGSACMKLEYEHVSGGATYTREACYTVGSAASPSGSATGSSSPSSSASATGSPSPSSSSSATPSNTVSPSGSASLTPSPSASNTASPSPTGSEPPVPAGFRRIYYVIESGGVRWGGSQSALVQNGPALYVNIPIQISGALPEADCLNSAITTVANCPDPIFGTVKDSLGSPVEDALVTAQITANGQSSRELSTITGSNGRYTLNLGNATSGDLRSYIAYNLASGHSITITAKTFDNKSGSATTTTASDQPLPDIIISNLSTTPSPSQSASSFPSNSASATVFPSGSRTAFPSNTVFPSQSRIPYQTQRPSGYPTISPTTVPERQKLTIKATFEGRTAQQQRGGFKYTVTDKVSKKKIADNYAEFYGTDSTNISMPELIPGKQYDLEIKGFQHLTTVTPFTATTGTTFVNAGILTAGDVAPKTKKDDLIEILDFSTLKRALNSPSLPTDLNGNGTTDVIDLSLLKTNLEKKGSTLTP